MLFRSAAVLFLLGVTACSPVNSKPCAADNECDANQRCRRGACGPICLNDSECGDAQICRSGACIARPDCAQDTDCATGFECKADRCQCIDDASCAANQTCTSGACVARKRCTADSECIGTGGRCEVTQGLCLPQCVQPQDCAPTLDPRVAFALYSCPNGTCTRRCTQDVQCGGQGLICKSGLCGVADCKTRADCPANQYCTSANFGRCESFTTCTQQSECARNFECKRFETGQCPPGFDCNQQLCLELPQCLVDGDCATGNPLMPNLTGYCADSHCQATVKCQTRASCTSTQDCIGGLCVPSVCRGPADCAANQACVAATCVTAPAGIDLVQMKLLPATALLEVGDTLELKLIGFPLGGSSFPLKSGTFTVTDAANQPSAAATVSSGGVLTAVSEGEVTITATVAGTAAASAKATVRIYPQVTTGRRVLVIDAATRTPIAGAKVSACLESDCATPIQLTTGADGTAVFDTLAAGPAIFNAASTVLRTDGLPAHERASVIGTDTNDLLIVLRANAVKAAAGFNSSMNFTNVSSSGNYWLGYVATSFSDVVSLTAQRLLGDNFQTEIPNVGQAIPVPGSLVIYTSPALGFPQEVKPKSLGFSEAGTRASVAFAGRVTLAQLTGLRSTDILGYVGAFDYDLASGLTVTSLPLIDDATDIDGDSLCSNANKCPMGSEKVPDYARFAVGAYRPARAQQLRTEVVIPKVASTFDTVLVAATQTDGVFGMLPTGFASRTAGAPAQDGTRMVDPVTVRSGAPFGGLEASVPGIWSMAGNAAGSSLSGRLNRASTLPTKVLVTPFLPTPTNSSYLPASRSFAPGQPEWASVYSSGGELARVTISGSEQQHVFFFAVTGTQTLQTLPLPPVGAPGADPLIESMVQLEVVTVDLVSAATAGDLYSFGGVNLSNWVSSIDGYSRWAR